MTSLIQQAYTFLQQGSPQEALALLLQTSGQTERDPNVDFLLAIAQSMTGHKTDAVASYQRVLQKTPENPIALMNMGADLCSLGKLAEAEKALALAQQIDADNPMIALNLGNVHKAAERAEDALACYDNATRLNSEYSEAWSNRGDVLCLLGQTSRAIDSYQRAITINAENFEALNNLGLTFVEMKRFAEGIELIKRALQIHPGFALAHNNLGIALVRTQRYDQGLAAYQQAITLEPNLPDPYFNAAEAFSELRQYEQAIQCYRLAIERSNNPASMLGALLHAKMKICDWSQYEMLTSQLLGAIDYDNCVVSPFTILGIPSTASQQKRSAAAFSAKVYASTTKQIPPSPSAQSSAQHKIRVGYLSSDLFAHATAYLMAELFELHDRNRFEIIAFSYGTGPDDAMRARLTNAVDAFHPVHELSDAQIAEKIRTAKIDILVDLKGHTEGARLGIMAQRPAPIQLHYLGYPGTLGTPFIDYLIADSHLVQPADYEHYSEKIIHLPGSYQVNDRQRQIHPEAGTRAEHGLPESAFIFCCFNNNWKITPGIFDVWMRLLDKNPTSVLWLLEDNPTAAINLKEAANEEGINPDRLVFASKQPLPEHLARHQHADLFLDTPYYNAHTTASDALWSGLPVLTVEGNTFASRVGGSLLSALNMPEMIAKDLEHYEQLAHELANNPDQMADLRLKLNKAIKTAPLFDTPKFTRDLESAYETMMSSWQAGLAPDHIAVSSK